MLYFDNQTVAPMTKEVEAAMLAHFSSHFVSPLSPHKLSAQVRKSTEEAIQTLYSFVDAHAEDSFVFTSSGTEAINQVIFSVYLEYARKLGKNHFLATNTAEAPVIMAMSRLQEMASLFEMVEVNKQGILTAEALASMITPRTCLLSLSWANGLTGVIQPLEEIVSLCKQRGILLHIDATHVLGKGYHSFMQSGADFLTFNGEQLHGPKGSGALFVRKGIEISPFIVGDKEQGELRAGNLNVPALIGLSKAVVQMQMHQDEYGIEVAYLRSLLEKGIQEVAHSPFQDVLRIPNVAMCIFPNIASEALGYHLNHEKLYATFGGNHFQKISYILKACNIDKKWIHSGMSFALSREHTKSDIERAIEIILKCVECLQHLGERI
jgi:cysteine desulfurase